MKGTDIKPIIDTVVRYNRIPRICGVITAGLGGIVLVGWAAGSCVLTSVRIDFIPMAPNTAILFLLLGTALYAGAVRPAGRIVRHGITGVACLSMILSAATLLNFLSGSGVDIDHWLIRATGTFGRVPLGSMSPITAMCFLLSGAALILLRRPAATPAAILGTLIVLVGAVNVIGYGYGAPLLYGGAIIPVALPTAIAFMIWGIGVIAAAGPGAWPLKNLCGASTHARLLRGMLPPLVLLMLITDRLNALALGHANSRVVLTSAAMALLSLLIISVVVSRVSCRIGNSIDVAEARITHLNKILRAIRDVNQLIVREKNPQKLIQEACRFLVDGRGYDGALIILTNETGAPGIFAEQGMGARFEPLAASLRQGVLPPCCEKARLHEGTLHIKDRIAVCASCPASTIFPGCSTMCISLKHESTVYGYLTAAVDHTLGIDAEEHALFAEVAGDVAFAMHNFRQDQAVLHAEKLRDQSEAELQQAIKLEAVGRLAGGVAHDFNNMLSVILNYADFALARLDEADPLYEDLMEIKSAGLRSAALTRQLLAFSRKQIVSPRVIDLNETIADHLKMLGRLIGEDIEIVIVPAAGLWKVLIDPSQIDQVLVNLAVNSRDAIGGVGTVTIATANLVIDEFAARQYAYLMTPGEYAMIEFSDSGSGMNAETLERIFEPFFTTKGKEGTGLGLATVYGIVKQNNGFIHVYSEPGQGTTFKIYLPRVQGEADAPVQQKQPVSLSGTETVLVAEDEAKILKVVRTILERHGYRILTAGTPGEACLLAERHAGAIHLLLTDVVMPVMNGKELASRIAQMKPGIKTIFMSGYTADVIAHRGVLDQGTAFIEKPFSSEALVRKIREVLDA